MGGGVAEGNAQRVSFIRADKPLYFVRVITRNASHSSI
jgi:hypothetical protein